jgi:hypothetical protein
MALDVTQLQHNAAILYDCLCSGDADRVYVDANGDLQVDRRFSFKRRISPLGDYSREAIDKVVICTLRRILNRLELNGLNQVVIAERLPEQGSDVAEENLRLIDRQKFAQDVSLAPRFANWMVLDIYADCELKPEELMARKVKRLARQIEIGKEAYHDRRNYSLDFKFYDISSEEEA